ncbi:unnamed protein product [Rhizoctonia solani]|uniref:Uncharacterized protein n=1 Tax=Rhizoctonia solani TaxID=456999 RepID=A0A8H3HGP1_9AGAM|nr:unnamed protein product [Rhizoctonia solani]
MPFSVGLLVGKVEAALGGILNKPALKERGLAKQKAATERTPAHATEPAPTGVPQHSHHTAEEQLAAEGGPGETIMAGGGGRSAI